VSTEGDDIAIEAFASGDARTNRVPRTRVEALSSGDNFTGKARSVLIENAPQEVELEAWKDATAMDLISHRILGNL
jgi:trans-aconitate methyltransferase